jgi:hypothetical protein
MFYEDITVYSVIHYQEDNKFSLEWVLTKELALVATAVIWDFLLIMLLSPVSFVVSGCVSPDLNI